jgi:hypothetical protein
MLCFVHDMVPWLQEVQLVLEHHGLEDLISNTLPRPSDTHPGWIDWVNWSSLVGDWLLKNIHKDLREYLLYMHPGVPYSDMIIQAIRGLQLPGAQGCFPEFQLSRMWDHRRIQFTSIEAYVSAWGNQVIACRGQSFGLDYERATMIMLYELEHELPILTSLISLQLVESGLLTGPEPMSESVFTCIVVGIIGAVQDHPVVEDDM